MLSAGLRFRNSKAYISKPVRRSYSTLNTSYNHEPLRVLFCGADVFSIYSLRAIHAFQQTHPNKIERIEVVCRPDKPFGGRFKVKQAVPIKHAAQQLGLALHQLDSFDNWTPDANLIVTASFGLLVPARIIESARYGGVNVHPSLLPDLRGAAPIQHALLHRLERTGVSVQTMHPTRFDHGVVLTQKSVYMDEIVREDSGYLSTKVAIEHLGPIAADLLVESIDRGLFVDPKQYDGMSNSTNTSTSLRKAPKITPLDRKIDWETWTSDEIMIRSNTLGQLWDTECYGRSSGSTIETRMSFDMPWTIHDPDQVKVVNEKWRVLLITGKEDDSRQNRKIAFRTIDGVLMSPISASIAGKAKFTGLETLQRLLEQRSSRPSL